MMTSRAPPMASSWAKDQVMAAGWYVRALGLELSCSL